MEVCQIRSWIDIKIDTDQDLVLTSLKKEGTRNKHNILDMATGPNLLFTSNHIYLLPLLASN